MVIRRWISSQALISLFFGLGLESKLLISSIRCVIQLSIMGQILEPIFENESPLRVAALSLCLVLISVLEVYFSRAVHRHRFMFTSVLVSISVSVFAVGRIIIDCFS